MMMDDEDVAPVPSPREVLESHLTALRPATAARLLDAL
jgi:hypothetical protein